MKIENFQEAKRIKEDFDRVQNQLNEIKDALINNREPKEKNFSLISFGENNIDWDFLDWKKMLKDAEVSLEKGLQKIKEEFENL